MDYLQKIVVDLELQSLDGIRQCFDNGVHPNDHFKNKPLIYELIGGYPRGPKFKESIKLFVEYGLEFDDKLLLTVLMDDANTLNQLLTETPSDLNKYYTLDCAFSPLEQASLLHICAEYNHLDCAKVLIDRGMNVNCTAGFDVYGFGGHTAIFHTVNQHQNFNIEMMNLLLDQSSNLNLTVNGLIWGKGYPWETFIPSVNPISYAMMGLLPQFQRTERDIYQVVSLLMQKAYGINYSASNIPNKYLNN